MVETILPIFLLKQVERISECLLPGVYSMVWEGNCILQNCPKNSLSLGRVNKLPENGFLRRVTRSLLTKT